MDSDDIEDLKLAQNKIRKLEERIDDLESRIPKKYDEVKFLNYQVRKRILVTGALSDIKISNNFINFNFFFNFRWRGIRRKSFSRLFNETGELKGKILRKFSGKIGKF